MSFHLIKQGLFGGTPTPDIVIPKKLKNRYDVVIIGAGGHGLAIAYYLAKNHGITDVAVLDKGYIGGGNTARNTAVIRSNYLTEEGVAFYKASLGLFQNLSHELDFNVMYSERGQLTLAHTDSGLRSLRWRAEVSKHLGVRSRLIGLDEIRELSPELNISTDTRYPIIAGLWHEDGATARHDAVAWGYAKGASHRGIDIHQLTEVTGFSQQGNRVTKIHTSRGEIEYGTVVQAVAGMSSVVAGMAGLKLAIETYPLQAMVTQPVKPFLNPLVSSSHLHCYIQQTGRGEIVIGGGSDPYPLYSTRSTLDLKETLAASAIQMFPCLANLKLLRQWSGMTDMTPDYSPLMGKCDIDNYYIDAGWGTWGFKATPICGVTMAELIATNKVPQLIQPFNIDRFSRFEQVNEMGATAASH